MYQYPKSFLSVPQLIHKLTSLGIVIDSYEQASQAFETIGYYRLKGYFYHQFDHNSKRYKLGTNLNDILKLYYFDTELSHIIFSYISQIEVALRVRLVNAFQPMQDALILGDPSVFDTKKKYWKNQASIASEIARSSDVFIEHNFNNHDGAIPLWASVEILSFGTLSKLIKNLKTGTGTAFSSLVKYYQYYSPKGNLVSPSKDMFASWIYSVSMLRNICAHNSRIYNRVISTSPQLLFADSITPKLRYNGLYQIMLSMKYLRPSDESWNNFVFSFHELLQKYNGIYDLSRMNFPNDWYNHFQV